MARQCETERRPVGSGSSERANVIAVSNSSSASALARPALFRRTAVSGQQYGSGSAWYIASRCHFFPYFCERTARRFSGETPPRRCKSALRPRETTMPSTSETLLNASRPRTNRPDLAERALMVADDLCFAMGTRVAHAGPRRGETASHSEVARQLRRRFTSWSDGNWQRRHLHRRAAALRAQPLPAARRAAATGRARRRPRGWDMRPRSDAS